MSFKAIFTLLVVVVVIAAGAYGAWYFNLQKKIDRAEDQLFQADRLLQDGNLEGAAQLLEQVNQAGSVLPPERQVEAMALLAQVYEKQEKPEAQQVHAAIVERFPESSESSDSLLALALAKEKSAPDEARSLFRQLKDRSTGYYAYAAQLGLTRLKAEEEPADESLRADLESLLEQLGEPEDALLNQLRLDAKDMLSELNSEILFSPQLDDYSQLYTVERGDSLAAIAKKFDTTYQYLQKVNNLPSPHALRPGRTLKVPKPGNLKLVVDKSDFRLSVLRQDGSFVKWYPVGIGKLAHKTRAGEYTINTKEIDPKWFSPQDHQMYKPGDPEYALGEPGKTAYWMGLGIPGEVESRTGLGIHGTNEPETVGTPSSAGCVRMLHEDIVELFELVPYYTRVVIQE